MTPAIAPEFESLFAAKGAAAPADPTADGRPTSTLPRRQDAPASALHAEASQEGASPAGQDGSAQASLFDVVLETRERPWDEWLQRENAPSPSVVGRETTPVSPAESRVDAVPATSVAANGVKSPDSDSGQAPLPFAVPRKDARPPGSPGPTYERPTSRLSFEAVESTPVAPVRLAPRRRRPSGSFILAAIAVALTGTWVVSQTGLSDRLAGWSGGQPPSTKSAPGDVQPEASVPDTAPAPAITPDPPAADPADRQTTGSLPVGDPVVGLVPTLLTGAEPSTAPSIDLVRIAEDGAAILAGRAPASSNLIILDNGEPIGYVTADDRGDWMFEPDYAMSPDGHEFSLAVRSATGGVSVPSQRSPPGGGVDGPEEQGSADIRDRLTVPSSDAVPLPVRKPN